jgi:hypothetical protein
MLNRLGCTDAAPTARPWTPARLASLLVLLAATPLGAQTPAALPPVTVGAGIQTAFAHTMPDGGTSTDNFVLNTLRLYVNGSATDKFKFTFNTEYEGIGNLAANANTNRVIVMDAIGRFEASDMFNVWVGRFLPPSDRANLYGNYYAHHWSVYQDGVQDGYPMVAVGRANGAAYWGQFGPVKIQAGGFDGASATSTNKLIAAGRVTVDFWDPEPGYYLNSTYYGTKNILAVGIAGQVQQSGMTGADANKAYSADFLLERKLGSRGSAFTIESELAKYDHLGGYNSRYGTDDGGYVLGSFLFPPVAPMGGRFEILGKYAKARFRQGITPIDSDYDQKTSEVNLNYIIKEFNARVMIFYRDTRFNAVQTDSKQFGVGLQLQM